MGGAKGNEQQKNAAAAFPKKMKRKIQKKNSRPSKKKNQKHKKATSILLYNIKRGDGMGILCRFVCQRQRRK